MSDTMTRNHILDPGAPGIVPDSTMTPMQKPNNLRRVADAVPGRLWIVALVGFFERAAFWGLTAPWRESNTLSVLLRLTKFRELHAKST